jgi:hypothetical protein
MKKIIAVALLIVFGAVQAMTLQPHSTGKTASASVSRLYGARHATAHPSSTTEDDDILHPTIDDDDEAAPPIHIHHAHSGGKKFAHKSSGKKTQPAVRPKEYSLLLSE